MNAISPDHQYRNVFKSKYPFSHSQRGVVGARKVMRYALVKALSAPMTMVRKQHAEGIGELLPSSAQVFSQSTFVIRREFPDVGSVHHTDLAYFHIVLDGIDLS